MLVTTRGGGPVIKFGLHVRLLVREIEDTSPVPGVEERPLLDQLEDVYANLVDQEASQPALLDSDMNTTLEAESRAVSDVRLTIETVDAGEALAIGLSCLRAAIHGAGIYTPHWDAVSPEQVVRVYTLEATEQAVEAKPLVGV